MKKIKISLFLAILLLVLSCASKITSSGTLYKKEKITNAFIYINQNTAFDLAKISEKKIDEYLTKNGIPHEIYTQKSLDLTDMNAIKKKFLKSNSSHLIEVNLLYSRVNERNGLRDIDFAYMMKVYNKSDENIWLGKFVLEKFSGSNALSEAYKQLFDKMKTDGIL